MVFFFSAHFRLKIFLFIFLDYRVLYLYFIQIPDISIICLVLVFVVLLASFVRKRTEFTKLFKGKF